MSTSSVVAARRRKASVEHVLVYMDGPQVITLKGSRKSDWIGIAVDINGMDYGFFCSQVSSEDLVRYLDGQVDLRYLFLYGKYKEYMVFDYATYQGGDAFMAPHPIAENLLPDEGFFARDHTESIKFAENSVSPSQTSDDSYVVDIDGNWEFPDFSVFSHKMSGVYSFLYCLNSLSRLEGKSSEFGLSRLEETFSSHPWQGGFSYVHFYDDLYHSLPKADRLNVRRIAYSSPGQIELEGNKGAFLDVEKALNAFRTNSPRSKELYGELYHLLSSRKLLAAESDVVRGSLEVQRIVSDKVNHLCQSIGLESLHIVYKYSENNWVITAKIVLSYYRRLSELFRFYAEGRVRSA